MGNCCLTKTPSDAAQGISTEIGEEWYIGNENFNCFSYSAAALADKYVSFHRILRHVWSEVDLGADPLNESAYNKEAAAKLTFAIHKGVPNILVREVVLKIIPFDDDLARTLYYCLAAEFDSQLDFLALGLSDIPFFGRKNLTNCCLSEKGVAAC